MHNVDWQKKITQFSLFNILFCGLVSLSWLIPNHTGFWKSFHSDLWICLAGTFSALMVCACKPRIYIGTAPIALFSISFMPWVQWWTGLLPYAGQAWVTFFYLVGAGVMLVVGRAASEKWPAKAGDLLFGSLACGALLSVGLALYQYLSVWDSGSIDIWIMSMRAYERPVGNLGQPNQLSTLFLLGIIAMCWAVYRRFLGKLVFGFAVVWLLFGIVLTQSRAGCLGAVTLTMFFRFRLEKNMRRAFFPAVYIALVGFLILFFSWGVISKSIDNPQMSWLDRSQSNLRWIQWKMLWEGALASPWVGYGWGLVIPAQLAVHHIPAELNGFIFAQSHNVLLDLIIWNGLPLGILLGTLLLGWCLRSFLRAKTPDQLIYFSVVLIIFVHSMLEYPFQYAYFLLPASFAAGAMQAAHEKKWGCYLSRKYAWFVCLTILIPASIFIYDSFAMEQKYSSLRMRWAGIIGESAVNLDRPLIMLTQFDPLFSVSENVLRGNILPEKLAELKAVVNFYPSFKNMLIYTAALAKSGDANDAQEWLVKTCALAPLDQCERLPIRWQELQSRYPELNGVSAPSQ